MNVIRARCRPDLVGLARRLKAHPHVEWDPSPATCELEFEQGHWARSISVGRREGLHGLIELIDNNPLVCADTFSVPDPGATLAAIALGPLAKADLIVEPPRLLASFPLLMEGTDDDLADFGWIHGAVGHYEDRGSDASVLALNAMVLIPKEGEADLDDLYEEAFGRSFYVQRIEDGDWDLDLVAGRPEAAFRLRLTAGDPHSLLTVQTMSDREGKVGSAQIVHAMNVMAGFEESLGVS